MEWIVIVGVVLLILFVFGAIPGSKKVKSVALKLTNYRASITEEKAKMMTGQGRASLPVLDAVSEGYRPVGGEKLLAVQSGASRMEMKSTGRYKTGGTSISIPIMKGVRYRVGSGSIRTERKWQATDSGRLLVTDKAVVFEGGMKNERITWNQIANIELFRDGFSIAKRSGSPRIYSVGSPDSKFAAVVELMLSRID